MKKFIFVLLLCLGSAMLFATEKENFSFPKIKDCELKVTEDVYTPANLWDHINGGADLYIRYGFVDLRLADYKNAEGITVHAEIYRHNSSLNAYGIYASERSPDYQFIEIGGQAYIGEGILNFFNGNCYVKLFAYDESAGVPDALKKVGMSIVEAMDQETGLPELLSVFPKAGKLPHTDKYIAKKFLGNDFLYNAFSIDYEEGYSLFLIEGADADEILKMVTSYLELTKQQIDLDQKSAFIIEDPYNGNIPVILSDQYFIGILNGNDCQNAKPGLDELYHNLKASKK